MSELITTTPQSADHSVQLEIVKFNELTSVMNNRQIRLATVAIADRAATAFRTGRRAGY